MHAINATARANASPRLRRHRLLRRPDGGTDALTRRVAHHGSACDRADAVAATRAGPVRFGLRSVAGPGIPRAVRRPRRGHRVARHRGGLGRRNNWRRRGRRDRGHLIRGLGYSAVPLPEFGDLVTKLASTAKMSPRTGQRVIAVIALLVAVGLSYFSSPLSFLLIPVSATVLGRPVARYMVLPGRRRFIADRAVGARSHRRHRQPSRSARC